MLRRFAAGAMVACVAIAVGAATVLVVLGMSAQRVAPILAAWCMVPCFWGLWAMLAPPKWVPERFPVWGAILGTMAALGALLVDLPARIFGVSLPAIARVFGVVAGSLFYYFLWMVVRSVYTKLADSRP
jgi:hypothetical protein